MGNCIDSMNKGDIKDPLYYSPTSLENTIFKVLLVGDSATGKSSMLLRYAEKRFEESSMPTLGIDFKISNIHIGQWNVQLQIWDSAGQERFRTITRAYYRGSHGILLCFDVTNQESFDSLKDWIKDIQFYAGDSVPMVLIGNKNDLEEDRVITFCEAQKFAERLGIEYIETSAKCATNVEKAFENLSLTMIKALREKIAI